MSLQKSIVIYFLISFAFLISEIFQLSVIVHIFRLLLIPFIGYSLWKMGKDLPILLCTAMFLCFVGDIWKIFPYSISLRYILIFTGLSYLIFSKICFKLIPDSKVKKLIFSSLPLLILWFLYYHYCVEDMFGVVLGNLYYIVLLYSIALGLFLIMSIVSYYNAENRLTLYTVFIAISFLIADTLMGLYIYIAPLLSYEILNVVFQITGYYFIYMFGLKRVDSKP